jgi:hypothetical protein
MRFRNDSGANLITEVPRASNGGPGQIPIERKTSKHLYLAGNGGNKGFRRNAQFEHNL